MILGKCIQHIFKLLIVFMVSIGGAYQSQASDMDGLIERFLQTNKEIALEYFSENIENVNSAISCLSNNVGCDQITVDAGTESHPQEFSFNQQQFLDFLETQYVGYRTVVGLAGYAGLNAGLTLGRRMALKPINGIRPLIFDTRDQAGQQEVDNIRRLYQTEVAGLEEHNIWLVEQSLGQEPIDTLDVAKFFKQKIAQTVQNFPFFGFMTRHTFSKESVLEAMNQLLGNYRRVSSHLAELEGDDRYEIFGFFNVFNRAIEEFTPAEVVRLQVHFRQLEEENTWLNQVIAIMTSGYTWMMIGCYTAATVFLAAGPIIALVCGAVGLYYAVPGLIKIGEQTIRLQDYLRSGDYSNDVYNRYMVNNAIAGVMYSIWFSSAIPSFTRNLVNIRTNVAVLAYATRWNGMRLAQMDRSMLIEEARLFWSYTWYYGREISLESLSENMGRLAGKANTLIPAVASTFWATANHVSQRNPGIFMFSDLLRINRELQLNQH